VLVSFILRITFSHQLTCFGFLVVAFLVENGSDVSQDEVDEDEVHHETNKDDDTKGRVVGLSVTTSLTSGTKELEVVFFTKRAERTDTFVLADTLASTTQTDTRDTTALEQESFVVRAPVFREGEHVFKGGTISAAVHTSSA